MLFLLKSIGEILAAGLLLWLMVWLLGMYTVVYRVLPSGRKQKVGYLWRIRNEYFLYDNLLPIFHSSRSGFVRDHEIRPLVVNDQQNKVQKTLGTFTDDGFVYNLVGNMVGNCVDPNARHTNIIDENGETVGYLRGSLRAKNDITVRAAGFAVLREEATATGTAFDVRVGFRDLMLPSALAYAVLFYPLRMLTESFTTSGTSLFMLVMLAYYLLFVAILYVIKYERTMQNLSIDHLVGLVDRNVGVGWLNALVIIAAAVALYLSLPAMQPLFAVILAGFVFNLFCFNGEWRLALPSAGWSGHIPTVPATPPASPTAPTANIVRTYPWAQIMEKKGIKDCKDELEIAFTQDDFDGIDSAVRQMNPFRNGSITSDEDLKDRTRQVLAGATTANDVENNAIAKIINSAYSLCLRYNLADFELYDLVLAFVQSNIKYVIDEDSDSIGNVKEYFRYASESLYDREGDCDCKSVLAYRIFEKLGVDVDLVTVKSGNADYYNHVAIMLHNNSNASIALPPEYVESAPGKGVYCESTSHGFHPGDVPEDVDVDSLIVIG